MQLKLTANEARVIGCLIEKSVVTPDQYPLTLNALTNACNQKSSRDPVMSLKQGEVQHVVRELEEKSLARTDENFKSRTEKYIQRFCNTRFSGYQFDPAQLAIICLLLLRGPQTPGELRARSGRPRACPPTRGCTPPLPNGELPAQRPPTLASAEARRVVAGSPCTDSVICAQLMCLQTADKLVHAMARMQARPCVRIRLRGLPPSPTMFWTPLR